MNIYLVVTIVVVVAFFGMLAVLFISLRRHRITLEKERGLYQQEKKMSETIMRAQNEKELETAQRIAGPSLHQKLINGRLAPHIRRLEELEDYLRSTKLLQVGEIIGKIQALKQDTKDTRNIARDISRSIFPPFLSNLFIESCERKIHELEELHPCDAEIVFESEGHFTNIQLSVLYNLYNIMELFVTNSLQNANAKQIKVVFQHTETTLSLTMSDDGVGFNFDETNRITKGIGIADIQGRASFLSPNYTFQSKIGQGTYFEIIIPFY